MAALAALLALAVSAAAADPFAAKTAEWESKGFAERERAVGRSGPLTAAAVVYSPREEGGDRLEFFVAVKGKAYLGYSHPSTVERLELDPTPAGRGFKDLLGDGSRVVAYRATLASLGSTTFHLLRWKGFEVKPAASFPEGRFVESGGKLLVAARELPLGRFLTVGCENFGTISRTAFKTTLHAPKAGRFVEVTASHPSYFKAEIARKEAALQALSGDLEKNAGEYLGLAISLYYDYAAIGQPNKGWDRQSDFFKVPPLAPPGVRACFETMRADLRVKLAVPSDWR
jgi:hypothetical protein